MTRRNRVSVVPLLAAAVLGVVSCGGGKDSPTTPSSTPAPIVSLSLSANSAHVGLDIVMLTWTSQNAATCTASGSWSGPQATSGSLLIKPTTSGTSLYSLECTGTGGRSASASAQLQVAVLADSTCALQNIWIQPPAMMLGSYIPVNNIFADTLVAMPSFFQCYSLTLVADSLVKGRLNWNLPLPWQTMAQWRVATFPSITYGPDINDNSHRSATNQLPAIVSSLPTTLNVNFDLTESLTGQYDMLLDVYVVPDPREGNVHQTEFWIRTSNVGLDSVSTCLGATIGGIDYAVCRGITYPNSMTPNDPTSYVQRIGVEPARGVRIEKASIPLQAFLTYFVARGWIKSTDYLLNISFGPEVATGQGDITINSYSITWK